MQQRPSGARDSGTRPLAAHFLPPQGWVPEASEAGGSAQSGSLRAPCLPGGLPAMSPIPIPGLLFARPPAPFLGQQVPTPQLWSTCPIRSLLGRLARAGTRSRGRGRAACAQSPGGHPLTPFPAAAPWRCCALSTSPLSAHSFPERHRRAPARWLATRAAPLPAPLCSRRLGCLPHAGLRGVRRSLTAAALRHWRPGPRCRRHPVPVPELSWQPRRPRANSAP